MSRDLALFRFVLDARADRETRLRRWRDWAEADDIDNHSAQAYDLFPAAYVALRRLGEPHRWLARLSGVYRQAWTRNVLRRAALDAAAAVLKEAGLEHIPPWWTDLVDGDDSHVAFELPTPRIVVRWADVGHAARAFSDGGWSVEPAPPGGLGPLGVVQAFDRLLVNAESGATIRLSDHLLPRESGETRSVAAWERTSPGPCSTGRRPAAADVTRAILTEPESGGGSYRWALELSTHLSTCAYAGHAQLPPPDDLVGALARDRVHLYAEVTGTQVEVTTSAPLSSRGGAVLFLRDELRAARRFDGGLRTLGSHRRALVGYPLHRLRRAPRNAARSLGVRRRRVDDVGDLAGP